MPIVLVPPSVSACQVDCPEGIERSVRGALYLRPASRLTLTGDEFEHIKSTRPDLAAKLLVIEELRPRVKVPLPTKAKEIEEKKTPAVGKGSPEEGKPGT